MKKTLLLRSCLRNFSISILLTSFFLSCSSEPEKLNTETVQEFCQKVAQTLNDKNEAYLESRMDSDKLSGPGLKALRITKEQNTYYPAEQAQSLKMGKRLSYEIRQGAKVDFIRLIPQPGDAYFEGLFRLSGPNQVYYYFSLIMEKGPDQKELMVADIHLNNLAQTISQIFKENLILNAAARDSAKLTVLNRQDALYFRNHNKIQEFYRLVNKGDYHGARSYWDALPEEIKNIKTVALYQLVLIAQGFPDEITTQVEKFQERFPQTPSLSYVAMRQIAEQGWTEKLPKVMKDIRSSMGGDDAALLELESWTYLNAGDLDKALAKSNAAIDLEPDFQPAYWGRLLVNAAQGNFDAALLDQKALHSKFGLGKTMQSTREEAKAFYESQLYKDWAKN